ncbi:MAG: HAD hydrolase-like protein [Patescibacteria group bacterium]|nr:HAD hydrolase-like protein [Patescibacteria group bacterium]
MTVYFDFDHTLFDTRELRQAIARIFLKGGVTQAAFDETYKELAYGVGYEPSAHAALLAGQWRDPAAREQALKEVSELMKSGGCYVFEGVTELLKDLKSKGHRLVILTLGNLGWQHAKIACSGLEDLFDRVEVVPGPGRKAPRLKEISGVDELATVVDDNPGELQAMMAMRPNFRCVYFHRPVNPYPNPGCEEVVSIAELRKVLIG